MPPSPIAREIVSLVETRFCQQAIYFREYRSTSTHFRCFCSVWYNSDSLPLDTILELCIYNVFVLTLYLIFPHSFKDMERRRAFFCVEDGHSIVLPLLETCLHDAAGSCMRGEIGP